MKFVITDASLGTGSKRELTPQGYLLIRDCKLARSGILEYVASDFQPHAFNDMAPSATIRVYRSPEVMLASTSGYAGAPVTDNHPPKMLSPENTRRYQKGHVLGDARVEDGYMLADLLVTSGDTIKSVERGKEEISNGYLSEYDFSGGRSPEGETYHAEQLNIKPNHVAIVAKGRCGVECRVSDSLNEKPIEELKQMAFITINGVSYEASEQVAQAVGILQATADSGLEAQKKLSTVDSRIEEAKAEVRAELKPLLDTKDAEIDSLKAKVPTADSLDKLVKERYSVLDRASKLLPKANFDGKSLADVRNEVVLARCADLKTLDGKSEDYVFARFDALEVPKQSQGVLKKALSKAVTDEAMEEEENEDEVEKARKLKMKKNRDRAMRSMSK